MNISPKVRLFLTTPYMNSEEEKNYETIQNIIKYLRLRKKDGNLLHGCVKTDHHLVLYWPHLLRNTRACWTLAEHLRCVSLAKLKRFETEPAACQDIKPILREKLEQCAGPLWLRSFSDMNFLHEAYGIHQSDYPGDPYTNTYQYPYSFTVIQLVHSKKAYCRMLAAPAESPHIRDNDHKLPNHVWFILQAWRLLSSRHRHDTDLTSFGLGYCHNGYLSIDWNAFLQHPVIQQSGVLFPSGMNDFLMSDERQPKITSVIVPPPKVIEAITEDELNSIQFAALPLYTRLAQERGVFKYGISKKEQDLAALTFVDPLACCIRDETWFDGGWYERMMIKRKTMAKQLVTHERNARIKKPPSVATAGGRKQFIFCFRPMEALKQTGIAYENVWFSDLIDEELTYIEIKPSLRHMANKKVDYGYVDETEEEIASSKDQTLLTLNNRCIRAAQNELNLRLNVRFKEESKNDLYAVLSTNTLYFSRPHYLSKAHPIGQKFCAVGEEETWRRVYDLMKLQYAYLLSPSDYRDQEVRSEFLLALTPEERDTLVRHTFVYASLTFLSLTVEQQKEFYKVLILEAENKPFEQRQKSAEVFKQHKKLITSFFTHFVPSLYQMVNVRTGRDTHTQDIFAFYSPYFFFLAEKISRGSLGYYDRTLNKFTHVKRYFSEDLKPSYFMLAWSSFARTVKPTEALSTKRIPSTTRWIPSEDLIILQDYPFKRHHFSPEQWSTLLGRVPAHTKQSVITRVSNINNLMISLVPVSYRKAFSVRDCFNNPATAYRIVLLHGLYLNWKVSSLQKTKDMLPIKLIYSLPDEALFDKRLNPPTSYHSDFYNNRFIGIELSRLKEEYDNRRNTPESAQSVEKTVEPAGPSLFPAADNTESCHAGM